MRDKILVRAILISVAVHLVAVGFVGRTSSTRLNAAMMVPVQQRLLNVSLVKDPLAPPPKPKPVVVQSEPNPAKPNLITSLAAKLFGGNRAPAPAGRPVRVANNAGGALNTGTASTHGDLGGMNSGKTPVGWVPGSDTGRGQGSGSGPGAGNSEPPRVETPYHAPPPPPPPPPPPAPKRVTVRVCEASGMLAGEHCKSVRNGSYNEGAEPRRICDKCKAPEPEPSTRRADKRNPEITHDVRPRIPDSVDEGLTLEVEIEYYSEADGGVSGVRVTKSSGNRDLDRAVTAAASQWRYNPAVQDGVPRKVKVTRTIRVKT